MSSQPRTTRFQRPATPLGFDVDSAPQLPVTGEPTSRTGWICTCLAASGLMFSRRGGHVVDEETLASSLDLPRHHCGTASDPWRRLERFRGEKCARFRTVTDMWSFNASWTRWLKKRIPGLQNGQRPSNSCQATVWNRVTTHRECVSCVLATNVDDLLHTHLCPFLLP